MKIGIIGAMDEEIRILKAKMKNLQTTQIAGCEFHQGELNKKQVILTKSGIGKVAAAVATTLLLEKFQPDTIIRLTVNTAVLQFQMRRIDRFFRRHYSFN